MSKLASDAYDIARKIMMAKSVRDKLRLEPASLTRLMRQDRDLELIQDWRDNLRLVRGLVDVTALMWEQVLVLREIIAPAKLQDGLSHERNGPWQRTIKCNGLFGTGPLQLEDGDVVVEILGAMVRGGDINLLNRNDLGVVLMAIAEMTAN